MKKLTVKQLDLKRIDNLEKSNLPSSQLGISDTSNMEQLIKEAKEAHASSLERKREKEKVI